jgi:hypothetical protein
LVAVLVLVVVGVACAPPARAPVPTPTPPPDLLFTIPRGAAAAEMRGEDLVKLPSPIELVAGQRVVILNEDVAMHYFFQQPVAPGQTLERRFDQPGGYTWSGVGSCSIGKAETLRVVVRQAGGAA